MIVLNLTCPNQHRFEGWFASAADFESQSVADGIACPVCGDHKISRLPSGPRIVKSAGSANQEGDDSVAPVDETLRRAVAAMKRAFNESEDVGERFPEEARRIHYRESAARAIRGVASRKDAIELLDEGIQVLPLPLPPTEKLH